MQARFFDAQVGRFLSTDPVHFSDQNPFTFNRYAYANNNPYRYTDPNGQSAWSMLGRLIIKGGDVAATTAGAVEDFNTLTDPNASTLDRVVAGASLVSELGPISARDVKGVAGIISGKAQVTRAGGKETTHAATSQRIANEQDARPDAKSVHLNQTIGTATGGEVKSPLRPDVATVRADGKVDVTEVLSPRQDAQSTATKYQDALGSRAGEITCVNQDC